MQLWYKISNGDIIGIGPFKDVQLGVDEGIEEYNGEFPQPSILFFKRTAPGVITERSEAEKSIILANQKLATPASIMAKYNSLLTTSDKLNFLASVVSILGEGFREKEIGL